MTKLEEALQHLAEAEMLIREEMATEAPVVVPAPSPAPPPPPPAPVIVPASEGLQNPDAFYDFIRGDAGELFPSITQAQVDGINIDLAKGAGVLPLSWMAYCLATDYHETAQTMQGVREAFQCSEEWRKTHLRYYPYYGRGKVQLTWKGDDRTPHYGYARASEELGIDLVTYPDRALDLEIAARVLITGMLEGWFSGKKLRDYLPNEPTKEQYMNARKIVNGTDKAELIAGYAKQFETALKKGGWL